MPRPRSNTHRAIPGECEPVGAHHVREDAEAPRRHAREIRCLDDEVGDPTLQQPCPVDVKRRMIEWWGPVIHEYYGGTEGQRPDLYEQRRLAHPCRHGRQGDLRRVARLRRERRRGAGGRGGTCLFRRCLDLPVSQRSEEDGPSRATQRTPTGPRWAMSERWTPTGFCI